MKQFLLAVKAALKVRLMYAVIVPDYKGIHWCWTWSDVQDWLRMYPGDVRNIVISPQGWWFGTGLVR